MSNVWESARLNRRRHGWLAGAIFSCWFLLAATLSTSLPAHGQVVSDDKVAAATVDALRIALVQEQRALAQAVAGDKAGVPGDYLRRLRVELRTAVLAAADTSGEVELATLRAAVRDRLARIDAYESAYGLQDGARTTRLNVLSAADLDALRARLRDSLRDLLVEAARLPEAAVPNSLRGRIFETRAELDGIAIERAARPNQDPPKLVSIGTRPSSSDPVEASIRMQRIAVVESAESAERALLVEVEGRLAWNPNDASLREVRRQVRSEPADVRSAVRATDWKSGWPPRRGEPPDTPLSAPDNTPGPRGPTPAGKAVDDLRQAASDEIEAISRRNWRDKAEASARLGVAADWVGETAGLPAQRTPWEISAASMSSLELQGSKSALEKWQKALVLERERAAPGAWHGDAELRDTEVRLKVLETEIRIRGPPPPEAIHGPHGPEQMRTAVSASAERARTVTYGDYAAFAIEHRRAVELQKLLPDAPQAERPAIQGAINEQTARRLEAEARAINLSYEQAVHAERQAYISGRGPEGARAAQIHRDVQESLRRQADATRALTRSYVDQGVIAPGRAGAIAPTPPSGTGATIADFNPGTLSRTSLLAEGRGTPLSHSLISLSGRTSPLASAPMQLSFDKSFSLDGVNSAEGFRKNPYSAPGGVIVDVKLPERFRDELSDIAYDPASQQFRIRLRQEWRVVVPPVPPETVRAALGFVLDRRVAAVDIGAFDIDVQRWLTRIGYLRSPALMTPGEQETLLRTPQFLRIVRINPALSNTSIGRALITADELIFSALWLDDQFLAAHSVFRGLDTLDLHVRFERDRRATTDAENRYKSVLTIDSIAADVDGERLLLRPALDYAVYAIPRNAALPAKKLESTSRWFVERHAPLRLVSPELQQLEEFAVATALLRAANGRDRMGSLGNLKFIVEPGLPTPSLLCRSDLASDCAASLVRSLTAVPIPEETTP